MQGDSVRVEKALQLIAHRERRYSFFPATLFGEPAWEMLLHLFVAHYQNESMGETKLLEMIRVSPEVGRRWLSHLVKTEYVERREEGDDVVLIDGSVDELRSYLDTLQPSWTADP